MEMLRSYWILLTLPTSQFKVYSNFTSTKADKMLPKMINQISKHLPGNQFVTLKYTGDILYSQLLPDSRVHLGIRGVTAVRF